MFSDTNVIDLLGNGHCVAGTVQIKGFRFIEAQACSRRVSFRAPVSPPKGLYQEDDSVHNIGQLKILQNRLLYNRGDSSILIHRLESRKSARICVAQARQRGHTMPVA